MFKLGDRVVGTCAGNEDVRCTVIDVSNMPLYIGVRPDGEKGSFPYQDPKNFVPEVVYNSKLYKVLK